MKHIIALILFFLFSSFVFAQVPNEIKGINYQGIVRESDGSPITFTNVEIKIGIYNLSNTSPIFEETHTVTTNEFGLFNLIIGTGTINTGNILTSSLWNEAVEIKTEADYGSGYDEIGTVDLAAVPYAFKAKYEGQKIDFNTTSGYLRISDGTIDANNNPVFIDSTQISVSGGGTDDQRIIDFELTSTNMLNIEIEDGNTMSVDLSGLIDDSDADPTNEIQDLSLNSTTNILTITNNSGATNIDLTPYIELPTTATTGQVLTWNGTSWIAQNSGTGADNWGTQSVVTGSGLSGDGTSGSPLVNTFTEVDGDNSNELQTITKSGSTVTLSNGGGSFTDDNTQLTESQVDTYVSNNGYLTSFSEVDGDITNEIQTLSISGSSLSLSSGGGSVTLPTGSDNQDLSLTGNSLSLTNDGSPVDLSGYLDNTDSQSLSISGSNLSISGGNSVDLSSLSDHDWYEANGTTSPNNINDNIYTFGRVGIGVNNPGYKVDIQNSANSVINLKSTVNGNAQIFVDGMVGNSLINFKINGGNVGLVGANSTYTFLGDGSGTSLVSRNGDIGIGTTSPIRPVDLVTNSYGFSQVNTAGNVRMGTYIGNSYTSSNIPGGSIGTETDNPFFIFINNNGEKFYVGNSSQSYNVGIGTNDPTQKLHITGNYASNSDSYGSNGDGMGGTYIDLQNTFGSSTSDSKVGIRFKTSNYANGQHTKGGILYRRSLSNGRGDIMFLNNSFDNTSDINITSDTKMIIQNNGDIGIGTTTPSTKLEVNGTITIDDSADPNELNRSSTGNANLVPIAYANISSTGNINTSSTNVSVNKTGTGQYLVNVAGETLNTANCIVSINTQNSNPRFVGYGSSGGGIYVFIRNSSSGFIDNAFSISIFKP